MILRMDAAAAPHRHMLQLQYVQRKEDNDDTSFKKVRWANIIKLWCGEDIPLWRQKRQEVFLLSGHGPQESRRCGLKFDSRQRLPASASVAAAFLAQGTRSIPSRSLSNINVATSNMCQNSNRLGHGERAGIKLETLLSNMSSYPSPRNVSCPRRRTRNAVHTCES